VTDSGSEIKATADKPGVSNLLTIHSSLSGQKIENLEEYFNGKGYGDLKSELTELISESLKPVRDKYQSLIKDKSYLKEVLAQGASAAQRRANKILSKVYRKVGFPDREKAK
jgi:tryptophanyl-tRNA synthetase